MPAKPKPAAYECSECGKRFETKPGYAMRANRHVQQTGHHGWLRIEKK